jgi:hypothetical protein
MGGKRKERGDDAVKAMQTRASRRKTDASDAENKREQPKRRVKAVVDEATVTARAKGKKKEKGDDINVEMEARSATSSQSAKRSTDLVAKKTTRAKGKQGLDVVENRTF